MRSASVASFATWVLFFGLSLSDASADWFRDRSATSDFIWGAKTGLQIGIAPSGFRPPEPRGLIRLGYPILTNGAHDLVNFIAIEPVVNGKKGYSELEKSKLDGVSGKRLWLISETADSEKLNLKIGVERFENGAEVELEIEQRRERPDEVVITTRATTSSAPMEYCILTATMGNMIRARELWLKDKVVTAAGLYPTYNDIHFAPHTTFAADRLLRLADGSLLAAITTDEIDPAATMPFQKSTFWHYRGAKVTQYWKHPSTDHDGLALVVNARHTYYGGRHEIPRGNAFENFEMRRPFKNGQQFIFGITPRAPAELGFTFAAAAMSSVTEPVANTNLLSKVTPEAWRIHRDAILIDGHNDLPYEMRLKANLSFDEIDISKSVTNLQTDIPRLRLGGVGAQFWAAYVPSRLMVTGGAARQTLEQIDFIHRIVARYPDTFAFARTADEIVQIHKSNRIACLIGIEGGHSIENSLALLRMYYELGVRYMTLTHSDSLAWADAATDKPKTTNGLSDFGRQVVREMNRLGMLVDISHVSTNTMNAVLDNTRAPIIASHSSAYAIAQHVRNIPDDILMRLKQNRGVVMINFYSGFVVPEGARIMRDMFEVSRDLREKFPDEKDFSTAMKDWHKEHPMPSGTVKDLVDHIDHIVKIAGVDHVGLGSDYDGVSQTPSDLPDVSSYPVITQELLNRRYAETDIKKILGGNVLRVLAEAEKAAGR